MDAYPALLDMQDAGLLVDNTLRVQRMEELEARKDVGADKTREVALEYIKEHDLKQFRKMKKCQCCGGGKTQAIKCLKCSGYEGKTLKEIAKEKGYTQKAIKEEFLFPCETCGGTGKIKEYFFNPFSPPQMKKLLYDIIGVPSSSYRGKIMMDEDAMRKILRWAKT
jgi:hypothetical protein